MDLLAKNFKFIREQRGLNQAQASVSLGFNRTTWNNYETGKSQPNLADFIEISKFFGYSASQLLEVDLSDVHLTENKAEAKKEKIVHPNVHGNVHLKGKKQHKNDDFQVSVVGEDAAVYGSKMAKIPITDMAAAAGGGIYNDGPVDSVDFMHLPPRLLKPNHTYLTVRVKGVSMAPTLQDGGYVVIRLLDKSEWATMHDQRVFVVIDTDGKAYLKRVKNRFKSGFIVLRSDSPDQASYPSFNLEAKEIAMIWYVELYFSAKMPNIHDQFYTKLQLLEDRLDELQGKVPKINHK